MADTGEGPAEVLPALSSVHSERAQANSQMAALEQPDRAAYHEKDSAASPSQPRRSGGAAQQQRQSVELATTPSNQGGGAAAADGDAATPFDNVLSVLERIKRRQSTPFSLAPGRQPYSSPVPFGSGEAALQRSRLGTSSLTPRAGVGQRPGHHWPAPYSAQRPAARQQYLTPAQLGDAGGNGGLFGEARPGTPHPGAASHDPQGRPQRGGLFTHVAGTPASTPRFGRQAACSRSAQLLVPRCCFVVGCAGWHAPGSPAALSCGSQAPWRRPGCLANAGGGKQAAAVRQPARAAWAPARQPGLDAHAGRRSKCCSECGWQRRGRRACCQRPWRQARLAR
jgi:hypothetical protein